MLSTTGCLTVACYKHIAEKRVSLELENKKTERERYTQHAYSGCGKCNYRYQSEFRSDLKPFYKPTRGFIYKTRVLIIYIYSKFYWEF
jgi:hypothetical protein